MNAYLRDWAKDSKVRTLADIIAFNRANADRALCFGQDIFLAAEETRGDLSEIEYKSARQMDLRSSRALGIDAYMAQHKLDAILFPANAGASIAAKAGYPSVLVPAGMVTGPASVPPGSVTATSEKETPQYPYGVTFTGRAWSEPVLLRLAYAFEQATKARRMPPGVPSLASGCAPKTTSKE
jgi:amidase